FHLRTSPLQSKITCWPSMALKESEAIVLRTYPMREADLLVTLFTRLEGKVRGVARSAKKSKRRFGGALEPLTYVRVYYDDRERQELVRLDSCDVLRRQAAGVVRNLRRISGCRGTDVPRTCRNFSRSLVAENARGRFTKVSSAYASETY